MGRWASKRGAGRRSAAAAVEHRRRRLVVAVDWAITAAGRRIGVDGRAVAVTVADVIERAADDGLVVDEAEAAAVLRERFAVRGGGFGLTTDAG